MPKRLNHEEFIIKINILYPNRVYKIIGKYVNMHSKILIESKYGKCLINSQSLLIGINPSIRSAINKTEYFINQAKEVHGDRYDYSEFIWINAKTKSKIICKIHGEFIINSNNHLNKNGCPNCGNISMGLKIRSNIKEFIEKANKVHSFKYNYSNSIYPKNNKEQIDIICNIHGKFSQVVSDHLTGYGCQNCAYLKMGYKKENFINASRDSKAIFYIIKFNYNNEKFYKMGITTKSIKERYNYKYYNDYSIDVILEYKNKVELVWELEKKLYNKYYLYKYQPKFNFPGYTECFNLDLPIKEISDILYHVMESDGFLTTAP